MVKAEHSLAFLSAVGRCHSDGTELDHSCSVTRHSIVPASLGSPGPPVLLGLLLLQCASPRDPGLAAWYLWPRWLYQEPQRVCDIGLGHPNSVCR